MSHRQVVEVISGLVLGMFVGVLASTVVAIALPRIVANLGGSQASYTLIVTTEMLAMTATVPLWGKLADLYNKKLLIQLALVLFVIGSLIAGFAGSVEMLIGSRVAQGIGAGGLTALTQVIMAALVPPRELGRYFGVFGGIFAISILAGPLIGGVLVDVPWLGWRWCFFIGVPFAVVAIVLLERTLDLPTIRRDVEVDYLGAFLILFSVSTLLVWSSLAGDRFAWGSWWTVALVGVGVLVLGAAVVVESRVRQPVVPLTIFRNRTVALTTVASLLVGAVMFGSTVFLAQYFQLSLGLSPTKSALLGIPAIIGLWAGSTVTGQLTSKRGRWKGYLALGGLCMTTGMGLMGTVDAHTGILLLCVYQAVLGVGIGMVMQPLVLVAQNDVPACDLGVATSMLCFFRSLGGSIGVSALGAVLAARMRHLLRPRFESETAPPTHKIPNLSELPEPVATVIREAYGTAVSDVFLIGAPLAALALVAILFVKQIPLKAQSGNQRADQETKSRRPRPAVRVTRS